MATVGPLYVGTGANFNDGGTTAWSSPTNFQGDTTSTAATCAVGSNGGTSQKLRGSAFGFTGLGGAVINGITVEIECGSANNNRQFQNNVQLLKAGTETGDNKSTGGAINAKTIVTFGGAADTWNAGLVGADVMATGFGISFKISRSSTSGTTTSAYRARITLDYTPASFAISAVIKKTGIAGSGTADAVRLVSAFGSGSTTLNAIRFATGSFSFLIGDASDPGGAWLTSGQQTYEVAFTADAICLASVGGGFTAEAITIRAQAGTFIADAIRYASSGTKTCTVDAIVTATLSGSFSAEAVRLDARSGSLSLDAFIPFALYAWIGTVVASDFVFDGPVFDAGVFDASGHQFTLWAALRTSRSSSFAVDSIRRRIYPGSFTIDAIKQGSFRIDALKGAKTYTSSFAVSAFKLGYVRIYAAVAPRKFYIDAWVHGGRFTIDAIKGPWRRNLYLYENRDQSSGLSVTARDVYLYENRDQTAAAAQSNNSDLYTYENILPIVSKSGSFPLGAFRIWRDVLGTPFTINAWIPTTIGTPFTIDALTTGREKSGSFTIASDIAGAQERRGQRTIDAWILGRKTTSFRVDAYLTTWRQGRFVIDAFLRGWFTLDAVKQSGATFTINARTIAGASIPFNAIRLATITTGGTVPVSVSNTTSPSGNVNFVTGTAETILPGCDLTVPTGGPVTVAWDIWISQDRFGVHKYGIVRVRRTGLTGEVLYSYSWETFADNTGGHIDHFNSQYVDNAPTDGRYIFTFQSTSGASDLQAYSDTRGFTLSGSQVIGSLIAPTVDAFKTTSNHAGTWQHSFGIDAQKSSPLSIQTTFQIDWFTIADRYFTLSAYLGSYFSIDAYINGWFSLNAYIRGTSIVVFPPDGGEPTRPTRSFKINIWIGIRHPELVDLVQTTFWFNAVCIMQHYVNVYEAIPQEKRTAAQWNALATDRATLAYNKMRWRAAMETPVTWTDYTEHVLFAETSFTQMARVGAGTFEMALRGDYPEIKGGEEVRVEVDAFRIFGGYITQIEQGYFFEAVATPKTILRGTDYNALFDRLTVYNQRKTLANYAETGRNYGGYEPPLVYPRYISDQDIIKDVCGDLMQMDLPLEFNYTDNVDAVDTPAPVVSWMLPGPENTWRVTMQSITTVTNAVFFIDQWLNLHYHDRSLVTAPFPITDGAGGISCRNLTISTDINQLKNDVFVWGTLARTVSGEIIVDREIGDGNADVRYWTAKVNQMQKYINAYLAIPESERTAAQSKALATDQKTLAYDKEQLALAMAETEFQSLQTYGRWQFPEMRTDIHHQEWVDKRAMAILNRYQRAIITASATIFDPGYSAGMVVTLKAASYDIEADLVIRSMRISFAVSQGRYGDEVMAIPRYDLTMGLDPETGWNIYDYLPFEGFNVGPDAR